MIRRGTAFPRGYLLLRADGVVLLVRTDAYAQDMFSGAYLTLRPDDPVHALEDDELQRLVAMGIVEDFDAHTVTVVLPPERAAESPMRTLGAHPTRVRHYYINSGIGADRIDAVRAQAAAQGIAHEWCWRAQDGLVIVLSGERCLPFRTLGDARQALYVIAARLPALFASAAVAFVEMPDEPFDTGEDSATFDDLETLILSQTDVTATQGGQAMIVCADGDTRTDIAVLLDKMGMSVAHAEDAHAALAAAQENVYDLLIVDARPTGMHLWTMLLRWRELPRPGLIVVIAPLGQDMSDDLLTQTIPKIDHYAPRPLNLMLLRQHVWKLFRRRSTP